MPSTLSLIIKLIRLIDINSQLARIRFLLFF
ncbi:hypothetical protein BN59_03803 [Legionella massiliensis]|uniref:Uncharacterized protein n=1 Tax=Legionella massiliensis TaxID=1034943 RepID=A0A078KYM0_9GAMM|nr:hypothetical protein BN59_03803 [Legionella massiliensis]CEE15223.1 hypothetical protein BN1094_03803 [Legionella massiliensis]